MTLSSLPIFDTANPNALARSRTAQQAADNKPSGHADLSKRSAWLREMERSQVSTWFSPFEERADANVPALQWPMHAPSFVTGLNNLGSQDSNAQPTNKQAETTEGAATGEVAQKPSNAPRTPGAPGAPSRSNGTDFVATKNLAEHLTEALKAPVHSAHDLGGTTPPLASGSTDSGALHFKAIPLPQTSLSNTTLVAPIPIPLVLNTPIGLIPEFVLSQKQSDLSDQASATENAEGIQSSAKSFQPSNAAVRLHAQWDAENVNLWFGMDGTAAQISDQAAIIIPELHRYLNAQGMRLGKVVCNGQVIFDPAEPPAPGQAVRFAQFFQQYVPPQLQDETPTDSRPLPSAEHLAVSHLLPLTFPKEVS